MLTLGIDLGDFCVLFCPSTFIYLFPHTSIGWGARAPLASGRVPIKRSWGGWGGEFSVSMEVGRVIVINIVRMNGKERKRKTYKEEEKVFHPSTSLTSITLMLETYCNQTATHQSLYCQYLL